MESVLGGPQQEHSFHRNRQSGPNHRRYPFALRLHRRRLCLSLLSGILTRFHHPLDHRRGAEKSRQGQTVLAFAWLRRGRRLARRDRFDLLLLFRDRYLGLGRVTGGEQSRRRRRIPPSERSELLELGEMALQSDRSL